MAPPTVGQWLKGFMVDHRFDLEDLLELSLEDFKKFLRGPEFDVSNGDILFLIRDWKRAKEALTSAPMKAEAITSAPMKAEAITSAPMKAEAITSAPTQDKTIIIIDSDSEENQKPAAVTPDKIRSELNSSSEDVTDLEANSKGNPSLQLSGGSTNLSGVDVPRLQQGLILGLQRLVEGFGDAGPTTEENECGTEITTACEAREEAPSQGSSPPRTRVQTRTVRARASGKGEEQEESPSQGSSPPRTRTQRQTHRTRVQRQILQTRVLEDSACTEATEEPVDSDDRHPEENRTSEAATPDELGEQATIESVSNLPMKRRKVDIDREETRKYGERYLLDRHNPRGVGRLGGSVQKMFPNPRQNHPRLTELGDIEVATFHDLWQPHGPLYAGQPAAIVRRVPDTEKPFAVFMRRTRTSRDPYATTAGRLLGWEYCGNYRLKKDNEVGMWASAKDCAPVSKEHMIADLNKVCSGKWDGTAWRNALDEVLAEEEEWRRQDEARAHDTNDPSRQVERKNMATRAMALGYFKDMPLRQLTELLVELDDFYQHDVILFDRYDEDVYNYIKAGITNKDKYGKRALDGNNCTASGWYEFLDQQPGW
jgi:hypothetical protein